PEAWTGAPWPAPTNVRRSLCVIQRNDCPLAGVRMIGAGADGSAIELIDATGWGLHHAGPNGLLADPRIQNRIEMLVLQAFSEQARINAGFAAGGQTIPQVHCRTENA